MQTSCMWSSERPAVYRNVRPNDSHPAMREIGFAVGALALLIVGSFVVWRVLSRRISIPCPSWLSWMVELDNPFARSNRAAFIVGNMELLPGMSVLDAGCGPGRVTLPLARAVGPDGVVVAMDFQSGMLASVVTKAKDARIENVRTVKAPIGQSGLEASRFDRAVMAAVLGEVPNRAAAMNDMFHVLKPGGVLAVAELVFDPHFQRRSVVRRLAAEAGFFERATFGSRLAYLMLLEKPK